MQCGNQGSNNLTRCLLKYLFTVLVSVVKAIANDALEHRFYSPVYAFHISVVTVSNDYRVELKIANAERSGG